MKNASSGVQADCSWRFSRERAHPSPGYLHLTKHWLFPGPPRQHGDGRGAVTPELAHVERVRNRGVHDPLHETPESWWSNSQSFFKPWLIQLLLKTISAYSEINCTKKVINAQNSSRANYFIFHSLPMPLRLLTSFVFCLVELFHKGVHRFSVFSDVMLVAWNVSERDYFHHRNQQTMKNGAPAWGWYV